MTVAGAANSKIDYDRFGDGSMCTLFEEIARENETKGIEKGIRGMVSVMRKYHIPDEEIVKEIQEEYNLTREEAEEYL